jgi:hypothetical protein
MQGGRDAHRGIHGCLAASLRLLPASILVVHDKVAVSALAAGESITRGLLRRFMPSLEGWQYTHPSL